MVREHIGGLGGFPGGFFFSPHRGNKGQEKGCSPVLEHRLGMQKVPAAASATSN